ncbi:hypothetical protein ACFOMH_02315 [Paracoccus mangrovi]|uniref:Flagellar protein FliL n=1 Tax=Paracoccus mangrovi TaxID=1715645 RepID=A0ABV7R212_9RHOB
MIKKILMLIIPLIGFVGGAIGGDMLHAKKTAGEVQSADSHAVAEGADAAAEDKHAAEAGATDHGSAGSETAKAEGGEGGELDWFKFPNQFFVPIIRNGAPTAIMVLTLSIEMPAAARPEIEAQENRLRDALLAALMIEANTGGFDGNFTSEPSLQRLRNSLLAAGQKAGGPAVQRILIEDIGRQDQ